jgi:predicted peroxiredoxin
MKFHSPQILAAALVAAPFLGAVALADELPTPQNIVISLQSDPLKDQEPACVVLQLGTALIKQGGAHVTIFATLDGVGIANSEVMESPQLLKARSKYCTRVDQNGNFLDPLPLPDILDSYLAAGGEILACPLCWVDRFGELSHSSADLIVYYANGVATDHVYFDSPVGLFLAADKVIDY